MTYDSTKDTEEHIKTVRGFLGDVVGDLSARSLIHDGSKLEEPEKSMYDEFTPKLRSSTYGSEEYKDFLKDMGAALQHHYAVNSHHPEHYPNGVNGMSLLDVIEMLADWKAAGMRHANGNITQSLEINRKRFNISDQLFEILQNTVKELGW
jgi:hypothetical protein